MGRIEREYGLLLQYNIISYKKKYIIFSKLKIWLFVHLFFFSFSCVIILIYIFEVTIFDNQIEISEVTIEKKKKEKKKNIIKVLDNVIYFINTYFHNWIQTIQI